MKKDRKKLSYLYRKSKSKTPESHLENNDVKIIDTFLGTGTWSQRLERFGLHDEARTEGRTSPKITQHHEIQRWTPEMRRAKTDLSEADLKRRQCLPIFEKNHKARMWLDKSNSLGGYPNS